MKFSIKDFFRKCDQVCTVQYVTVPKGDIKIYGQNVWITPAKSFIFPNETLWKKSNFQCAKYARIRIFTDMYYSFRPYTGEYESVKIRIPIYFMECLLSFFPGARIFSITRKTRFL